MDIDVSFDAQTVSIFGPSGAGKTSILDAIAGLRNIVAGEVEIGGRVLYSSSKGINLSPQQRSIGYVPQEAALFPHMSVRDNVVFGANRPSSRTSGSLKQVAELLEIDHLLNRPVTHLSGGESQRVALARAILSRPRLLLLDEPLASLDIGLKERIIPYLRRVRDEFKLPMIYVSHNPTEVLSLADWVIMIHRGLLVTQGVPQEVLMSRGAIPLLERDEIDNVFDAHLVESDARGGRSKVRLAAGPELTIAHFEGLPNEFVQVAIHGDDILVAKMRPEGISAANVLRGVIRSIDDIEGQSLLKVDAGADFFVRLTNAAVRKLELQKGTEVFLVIKARSCLIL